MIAEHKANPYSEELPVANEQFEVSNLTRIEGEPAYVIKETRLKKYLKVSPVELYLWQYMDGRHSIADINLLFHNKFGIGGVDRIDRFVELLDTKGFITIRNRRRPLRISSVTSPGISLFKPKVRARGDEVNRLIEVVYRRVLWPLFTPVVQVLLGTITLGGAILFAILKWRLDFSFCALTGYSLCESLSVLQATLVTSAYFVVILIFHEMAHAVTCKHFGCHINNAGFTLYFGMPAFFVDTTDVWMTDRRGRIMVSWAGPYANFFLGALTSISSYLMPQSYTKAFLFHFATVSMSVGLINLIPLLKLDGYYILEEALDTYNLREKAFRFVLSRNFLRKLWHWQAFTHRETRYVVYGVPALLGSIFIVLITARIWADLIMKILLSLGWNIL